MADLKKFFISYQQLNTSMYYQHSSHTKSKTPRTKSRISHAKYTAATRVKINPIPAETKTQGYDNCSI